VVNYSGFTKRAATPVAGFAKQNGTPTIISWTVPNDGQLHRVMLFASADVTSAETGGQVSLNVVYPDGAAPPWTVFSGNQGTGTDFSQHANIAFIVGAGSTVTLTQTSALTGGATTVWAELWGS